MFFVSLKINIYSQVKKHRLINYICIIVLQEINLLKFLFLHYLLFGYITFNSIGNQCYQHFLFCFY